MFSWFKVLIINLSLTVMSTAASNKTNDNSSGEKRVILTIKDKIELGMPVRDFAVDSWPMEALKYNASQIHSLQEIYAYLQLLAACPYGHVKLQNLTIKKVRARLDAITENGNYIPYLNISIGSYVQKPAIVIVAGAKGCHWLTVAAAMNLAQQLVVLYDTNYKYTSRLTWIIVPVLNPDGYNATLSNEKMRNWPKNMGKPTALKATRIKKEKDCFGVDLCLNFEYQWITYNYQNSSWCDDDYADKPFTQNESKAIRDTVRDNLDTIKIFVSLAQNGRLLMYPFRYTLLKPIFWKVYEKVVESAAKAAYGIHKRFFDYGHVLNFKNKTAGELDDWVMAHLGVSLGFTYEIAEWSNNNKTPSTKEIQWTNNETFAALTVIGMMGMKFHDMGFLPSTVDNDGCRDMYNSVNVFAFVAIILLQIMFLLK